MDLSVTNRAKLDRLTRAMEPLRNKGYKYRHFIVDGIYAREMSIPQGGLAAGVTHRNETLSVVTKGDLRIMSDEGVRTARQGAIVVSKPGSKRTVYAIGGPATFLTIHRVHSEELKEIIEELTPEADSVTMGVDEGLLALYRNGELIRYEEIQSNPPRIDSEESPQRLLPFDD